MESRIYFWGLHSRTSIINHCIAFCVLMMVVHFFHGDESAYLLPSPCHPDSTIFDPVSRNQLIMQSRIGEHGVSFWKVALRLLREKKTSLLLLITNTFIACLLKGGKPRKVFFLQTLCFTSYRDSEKSHKIYMCLENLIRVKSAKVWRTSKNFCSSDWHFHLLPSPPQVGEC